MKQANHPPSTGVQEFTEHVTLLPTREFNTGEIDGVEIRVPITTPGSVVIALMNLLNLEPDDEWDDGAALVITAQPRATAVPSPWPPHTPGAA